MGVIFFFHREMLRLVKKFDLMRDIYEKIPDSKLQFPNGKLTMEASRLAIVGHERTGHILVSYDAIDTSGTGKVSYIDIFDPSTKALKSIYKHDIPITCVGATISENHTLLAFTILLQGTQPDKGRGKDHEFHSLIVELREGGKHYKMKIRKGIVQKVQFLYIRKPGMFYLLFFFDKLFVHLYQIPTKQKRNSGVEITAHPNLVKVIAKHFVWYEWDIHRNYLYILQKIKKTPNLPQETKTEATSTSSEAVVYRCVLKCLFIPDKTYDEQWEIPLKITLVDDLPELCGTKFYYGLDHRAQAPSSRFMHIIRLGGNAFVLCQQHPTIDHLASSIKVTLYLLHQNMRLEITIPMNNYDYGTIARTRVLFAPIGNMVLIYIPEIYIQLVDCGAHHPPYPGLLQVGNDLATKLPSRKKTKPGESLLSWVTTFPTAADPSEMGGHCLLDCMRGICYEYLVDRSAVLTIFNSRPDYLHVPALHLALVHMQDKELVDEILRVICTDYTFDISPLLREFLIGAPYLKAKKIPDITPQLLCIMPLTSLPSLEIRKLTRRWEISCHELKGYYVLPSLHRLTIRDTEQPKIAPHYQHDCPGFFSSDARYIDLSTTVSASSNRFGGFFRSFLNLSGPQNELQKIFSTMSIEEDCHDTSLNKGFSKFILGFTTYATVIFKTLPREKITAMAKEYRCIIIDQTNQLFQKIAQTTNLEQVNNRKERAMVLYQVLECFYCALEELSYPCPKGFSNSFVTLGNQCLPRSVFLQYIERGVFSLNVPFVESIVKELTDSEEDILFKYELLSHLKRDKSLEIMRSHNEYVDYLLQYHLSKLQLQPTTEDYASTNDAGFISRTAFLNAIRDQKGTPEIMSLIKSHSERLHTKIIQIAICAAEASRNDK